MYKATLKDQLYVFQVLSPSSLEVNPCNLIYEEHGSWDLPIRKGSQVLSHKYDINVYMATLYEGKACDTC